MDITDKNIKYGITGPTSLSESTDEEKRKSIEMDQYMVDCGFFESEDAAQTRERVLGKLDFLVKQFVLSMAERTKDEEKKKYGGKIFTFGSYRLGVHDKGADIDALCIVPRHVTRRDFFTIFHGTLASDSNITEITKVEEAYVPLIKFKYQNISIDLVFSRLNVSIIKDNINLLNDQLLKNMDEKCILSLNGSRVTDEILSLVPNTMVFHSALRAIKYWAKRRCVYGNAFGYFGGVAFALCVARVCQLYPKYSSFGIVYQFFETFSQWKWPAPVLLKPIIDLNFNLKVWDPKTYPSDKYHKMPVITPAYPSMCSTHNVTTSTQNFIQRELARGYEILKTSNLGSCIYKDLFVLSDFFTKYKQFIQLIVVSTEENDFAIWEGYIESKVRILASKLENMEDITGSVSFPKAFKIAQDKFRIMGVKCEEAKRCTSYFIAIELAATKTINKKVFIDQPVREFITFINEWDKKSNSMHIEINSLKRREVSNFLKLYYNKGPKSDSEASIAGDKNTKVK